MLWIGTGWLKTLDHCRVHDTYIVALTCESAEAMVEHHRSLYPMFRVNPPPPQATAQIPVESRSDAVV